MHNIVMPGGNKNSYVLKQICIFITPVNISQPKVFCFPGGIEIEIYLLWVKKLKSKNITWIFHDEPFLAKSLLFSRK